MAIHVVFLRNLFSNSYTNFLTSLAQAHSTLPKELLYS